MERTCVPSPDGRANGRTQLRRRRTGRPDRSKKRRSGGGLGNRAPWAVLGVAPGLFLGVGGGGSWGRGNGEWAVLQLQSSRCRGFYHWSLPALPGDERGRECERVLSAAARRATLYQYTYLCIIIPSALGSVQFIWPSLFFLSSRGIEEKSGKRRIMIIVW
jgi:hypothetical protein